MRAIEYGERVTIRTYHHGDLRSALVSEGVTMLREQAAEALSLRELAKRVGVSATAVYRHFADKQALMAVLAQAAVTMLGADQRAAAERAGGGLAGFEATGAAYVRFALANPALFRLAFAHPMGGTGHGGLEGDDDAMAMLRANAAAATPPGADVRAFAVRAWSLAHGLALLMLDGHVPADEALIDAVIDARMLGAVS